ARLSGVDLVHVVGMRPLRPGRWFRLRLFAAELDVVRVVVDMPRALPLATAQPVMYQPGHLFLRAVVEVIRQGERDRARPASPVRSVPGLVLVRIGVGDLVKSDRYP